MCDRNDMAGSFGGSALFAKSIDIRRFAKRSFYIVFCLLLLLLGPSIAIAQATSAATNALDRINFGDTGSDTYSEAAHAFVNLGNPSGTGAFGLTWREIAPSAIVANIGNPADNEVLTFTMACSPTLQNYLTIQLWGSDTTPDVIYLYSASQGYMLNNYYSTNLPELDFQQSDPILPGRFVYETIPIPLSMTSGKTTVTLTLNAAQSYNYYASTDTATTNLAAGTASRPIYSAFTHTNPYLIVAAADPQGTAPTAQAATPASYSSSYLASILSGLTTQITNIEKNQVFGSNWSAAVAAGTVPAQIYGYFDEGKSPSNNYTTAEWLNNAAIDTSAGNNVVMERLDALAYAYVTPNFITTYYQNGNTEQAIVAALDSYSFMQSLNGCWGDMTAWNGVGSTTATASNPYGLTAAQCSPIEGAGTWALGSAIVQMQNDSSFLAALNQPINSTLEPGVLRYQAYQTMLVNHIAFLTGSIGHGHAPNQDLLQARAYVFSNLALRVLDGIYGTSLAQSNAAMYSNYLNAVAGLGPDLFGGLWISAGGLGLEVNGTGNGSYDGGYGQNDEHDLVNLANILSTYGIETAGSHPVRTVALNAVHAFSNFIYPSLVVSGSGYANTIREEEDITFRKNLDVGEINAGGDYYAAAVFNDPYAIHAFYLEHANGIVWSLPTFGSGNSDDTYQAYFHQYLDYVALCNMVNAEADPSGVTFLNEPAHGNGAWADPSGSTIAIQNNGEKLDMVLNYRPLQNPGQTNKPSPADEIVNNLARIHDTTATMDRIVTVAMPASAATGASGSYSSGAFGTLYVGRYGNYLVGLNWQSTAQTMTLAPDMTSGTATDLVSGTSYNLAATPEVSVPAGGAVALYQTVPTATLSATALAFGSVGVTLSSSTQTVTLSNSGTGPLLIGNLTLGGRNASAFSYTTNCAGTLAAGASCTLTFTFTPTAAGALNATFSLTTCLSATAQTIALSGTGIDYATTTALSATPMSATYGSSVTLTATVTSSAGTPGGTVTFASGSTILGAGVLNSSGVATLTTSALPGGTDSLTAGYGGAADFAASTSSTVTETISSASTTTVVSSSVSTSSNGANVTLTATVTSPQGTPAGTVTFYSNRIALGTATINSSGVATWATTTLPVGSDALTASYNGTADFATSTSAAVGVSVSASSIPSYPALTFLPGIISTLAGTGVTGHSGDAGVATAATMTNGIRGIAADAAGDVYFVDTTAYAVRVVYEGGASAAALISATNSGVTPALGYIYTVAGVEGTSGTPVSGSLATSGTNGKLTPGAGMAIDTAGDIFVSAYNNELWVIYAGGSVAANLIKLEDGVTSPVEGYLYRLAGTGTAGAGGNGALAISATLYSVNGVWVDNSGNVYTVDEGSSATCGTGSTPCGNTVREISAATGYISVVAGANSSITSPVCGTNVSATCYLNQPYSVAVDAAGDIYIADKSNNLVRMVYEGGAQAQAFLAILYPSVTPTVGYIYTVAGGGSTSYPAYSVPVLAAGGSTSSYLKLGTGVTGIALDAAGDLYIVDNQSGLTDVIEVNSTTGYAYAVAGNGVVATSTTSNGDGGLAPSAEFDVPRALAVDAAGRIYVTDSTDYKVRQVGPQSLLTFATAQSVNTTSAVATITLTNTGNETLVFNGTPGFSGTNPGDFAVATASSLNTCTLTTLAVGASCNLAVTFTPGAVGTRTATLTVFTNGILSSQTASVSGTGQPGSTTTTLGASPTSLTLGQSTTLTATVTGTSPTGTVTFYYAGTSIGTATTSSGAATLVYTPATAGTLALTAAYGGDAANASSTSAAINITVIGTPTSTGLTLSGSTADYGSSVTLTALVTSAAGTPTGTVTFYSGSTSLGASALNGSGMAALTTTALPVGVDSITAVYGGSSSFASSTSTSMSVSVYPAGTTIAAALTFQAGIINTIAGTGTTGHTGDGGRAAAATMTNGIRGISADAAGDVYFVDSSAYAVRVVYQGGTSAAALISATNAGVTPVAGDIYTIAGIEGTSGTPTSGYLATNSTYAKLTPGAGLTIDTAGDVYFSGYSNELWVVYAGGSTAANLINLEDGVSSPVEGYLYRLAGTGTSGTGGNGGLAINATLYSVNGIRVDGSGNVYTVDQGSSATCGSGSTPCGNTVRMISASTGDISIVAGANSSTTSPICGTNVSATSSSCYLNQPYDVAVDLSGDIYIDDKGNGLIRMVYEGGAPAQALLAILYPGTTPTVGYIYTIAGNTTGLGSGVTLPTYASPVLAVGSGSGSYLKLGTGDTGMALDQAGNLYVVDNQSGNTDVIEINAATGYAYLVAGTGTAAPTAGATNGDGGLATNAQLDVPRSVNVDAAGRIYISDASDFKVRQVGPQGMLTFSPAQDIDTPSSPAILTLNNVGNVPLTFNGTPGFSGTNAGDFALDPASSLNTCTLTTLAVGASCNLAITFTPSAAGTRTANLTILANGILASQTAIVSGTGQLDSTTTTLGASPGSVVFGQAVTFTASVTGSSPTGTVTFYNSGMSLGTVSVSSGTATLTYTTTAPGTLSITGVYSGDTVNASSTSTPLTVTVSTYPTQTTLSSSASTTGYGDSIMLTATVTSAGTATGTVTFFSGSTSLGTAALNSSSAAMLTTTSLAPGADTLTAVYSGDASDAASTSAPVSVTVSAAALVFEPGVIATIAGTGSSGYTGDGGLATSALVTNGVRGIVADAAGDVFFVDDSSDTVRVIYQGGASAAALIMAENPTVTSPVVGDIYVIAGVEGSSGTPTTNQLAASVKLTPGGALGIDPAGDIYVGASTDIVWVIYAGGANTAGTNLIALEAGVSAPTLGYIYPVAGSLTTNVYAGDGSLATASNVGLRGPNDIKLDSAGNMYIADEGNNAVRKVSAGTGIITTIAGGGGTESSASGSSPNGAVASTSLLNAPYGLAVDAFNNVYITDKNNNLIRMIYEGGSSAAALITLENPAITSPVVGDLYTIAGGGSTTNPYGVMGTSSRLNGTTGIALDSAGNLYLSINGYNLIAELNATTGYLSVVAGNGTAGYAGENAAATSAELDSPRDVTVDLAGRIYVTDATNFRVREISQGIIVFPAQAANTTSAPKTIQLTNVGNATLTFTGQPVFGGSNAGDFSLDTSASLNTCNLVSLQPGAICQLAITYTPMGSGSSAATLSFATNGVLSTPQIVLQGTILPATSTALQSSSQSVTYGSPVTFTATVTGAASPVGTVSFYNNGSTLLGTATLSSGVATLSYTTTAAGTLAVTASYAGNSGNAPSISSVVSVTVAQASASVSLSNLAQTYTGSPLSATATTNPAGLAVSLTYNGSTTTPTAAGTYAVVAAITDPNYTGTVSGSLVISPVAATIVLSNLTQTYTGSALSATATTNPAGLAVSLTYNGLATAPTAAGSYAVAAAINNANYTGTTAGTLIVSQASASVSLSNLAQTYTSSPLSATATTNPAGLALSLTYNGSATAPTAAGSYAVVATVNDPNYSGSATGTLTIAQATASVTLGNLSQAYTGSPLAAMATTIPAGLNVSLTYNGSSVPPTAVGSYAVVGTISDPNYTGSTSGTLVISYVAATASAPAATNLGSAAVGSSVNQTVSFTILTPGTIGTPVVVTQGASGLDFTDAGDGSCTTNNGANYGYNPAVTCTVDVTFTPKLTGIRYGAVLLRDVSGNLLATASVYGVGSGPQIGFLPGAQSTIGGSLSNPAAVAVDASGNVYIANQATGQVFKGTLSAGTYTQSSIGTGLTTPVGVAIDGTGNLYVADKSANAVYLEMPSGGSYLQTTAISGLNAPTGVAVDASGNLYIVNSGTQQIFLESLSNGAYTQSTIGSGFAAPAGVAVDGSGNVYVSDPGATGGPAVYKETPASGTYTQTSIGGGLQQPQGLAVDNIGNVYVADTGLAQVLKLSPGSGSYAQTVVQTSGLTSPAGLAVDGGGNLYVADSTGNQVVKEDYADAPSLAFASTNVGFVSSDSPQSITVQNIGNAALTIASPGLASPTDFGQVAGSGAIPDCANGASLSAGAGCNLSLKFAPLAAGSLSEAFVLTDNALNLSAATQSISLAGTATAPTITVAPANPVLNPATVGMVYSQSFTAGGGSAPYSYQLTGGSLAAGISLSASGLLTGTPTAAGVYSFTVAATDNYSFTGSQAYSLTVNQGTATITLSNLSQTYTGSVLSATAATNPAGLAVSLTYSGSTTTPTAAGSYPVVATVNDPNYTGTATGTLVISQATATVSLSNLAQTYAGSPLPATVTTNPAGLAVNLTYNGSAAAPTAAGSYTVVATVNDPNYTGTATGTLVISQATASVTLSNLAQTYTGSPLSAAATANPAGLAVSLAYNGVATAPTGAGSYPVVATVNDPNYIGTATGTLVISPASATVTLSSLSQTYTGSPLPAIATTNPTGLPISLTYNGSPTAPSAAGSYPVVATVNNPNYTGAATGTLVISPATATITLSSLEQTYTGSSISASATTNPTGLAVALTYNGFATAPTAAGSYAVVATVTDPNYAGTSTGTLVISPAVATVIPGSLIQTYTGSPLSATATTNPAGLAVSLTYNGSSSAPTAAGSYTVAATVNNANYNGTTSATMVINPAAATVTLSNLAQTYTGLSLAAQATTNPAGLPVGLTYNGSAAAPTAAGNYTVAATINTVNYNGTASGTLAIAKASSSISFTASPVSPRSGQSETLSAQIAGAGQIGGTVAFLSGSSTLCTATLNGSGAGSCAFIPAADGNLTVNAAYLGDANHANSSSAQTLFVYDPAVSLQFASTQLVYPGAANVTVCIAPATSAMATGSVQIYDGSALLTTQTVQGGGCAYWYISPGLNSGTHTMTAVYSGDRNNLSGTSVPVTVTVSPVAVNMSASCWNTSFAYGGSYTCTVNLSSNAGAATGNLTYTVDGTPNSMALNNGNAEFTIADPNVGSHTVVLSYAAQGNFAAAGPVTESFTVTAAPTQIQLSPSSYYQSASSPLTLTATLTSSSAGAPTNGTVAFYDGSTLLGSLSAAATVSFSIQASTVGTHSYSAAYVPGISGNYAAANSASVTVQLH